MRIELHDFVPPAREDKRPWTVALIEEAQFAAGPYTLIDTVAIEAATDPAYPGPVDLESENATQPSGWYRVVWEDEDGNQSEPTLPVENLSEVDLGVRPPVVQVATLLRSRTKVRGGKEAATFTAETRPTADEVDELIDEAVQEVLGRVKRPEAGTDYEKHVRSAVRLYTAILVEVSYFPEQVKADHSPVAVYERLYEKRIKALEIEAAEGEPGGGGEGGNTPIPADPQWGGFPEDAGGLVGWKSHWLYDDEAWRRRWG